MLHNRVIYCIFLYIYIIYLYASLGPSGKIIPVQKSTLRGLTYSITAQEVGEHIIQILVNGQHIQGSPFRFIVI